MKIICINAENDPTSEMPCDLIEGDIYTAVDYYELSYGKDMVIENRPTYILAERDKRYGYCVKRFIPLSDIDETELVNEKKEAYAR